MLTGAADQVMPAEDVLKRFQLSRHDAFIQHEESLSAGNHPDSRTIPAGINLMQLSGMDHILANDSQWMRWYPAISSVITSFVLRRRQVLLSDRELLLVLAYVNSVPGPTAHVMPAEKPKTAGWRDHLLSLVHEERPSTRFQSVLSNAYHLARARWGGERYKRWVTKNEKRLASQNQREQVRLRSFENFLRVEVNRVFDPAKTGMLEQQAKELKFPDPNRSLHAYCGVRRRAA